MKDHPLLSCENMLSLFKKDVETYEKLLKIHSKGGFFNKSHASDKLLLRRLQSLIGCLAHQEDNQKLFKAVYVFYKIERESCQTDNLLMILLRKSLAHSLKLHYLVKVTTIDVIADEIINRIQMDPIPGIEH